MKHLLKTVFLLSICVLSLSAANVNLLYDAESDGSISPTSVWIVDMIKEAGKLKGIDVHFEGAPWSRALELVKEGIADGLINASYKASRAEYAVYPLKEGKPDISKSLKAPAYHLYKRKEHPLEFDGTKLLHAEGAIGAIQSYAVIDDLKALGAEIVFGINETSNLNNVLHGQYIATAELADIADPIIQKHPEMKKHLLKLPIPVRQKEYYLIFSKHFYKKYPDIANTIWEGIAELKTTEKYVKARQ